MPELRPSMISSRMFDNWKITLASQSPRRRELLGGLGLTFSVEPAKDGDESYPLELPHNQIPEYLARRKSESFHRPLDEREILITADTLVFLDEKVLGKPVDREDAFRMLRSLSGRKHQVLTGVCLRTGERIISLTDTTDVSFSQLTDEEINYYIDNYKPFDKAGAYGIQDWIGLSSIESITGSYFNVMGLPVHMVYQALKNITSR